MERGRDRGREGGIRGRGVERRRDKRERGGEKEG